MKKPYDLEDLQKKLRILASEVYTEEQDLTSIHKKLHDIAIEISIVAQDMEYHINPPECGCGGENE
jgi:hypothetical protein